jgi:hypothetical protein
MTAKKRILKESKEKNIIEQMSESAEELHGLIIKVADEVGIDTQEAYGALLLYQLIAIHQHLEQLVYKNEKVQT